MRLTIRASLIAALAILVFPAVVQAQGLYVPGAGAVQGGMGGVSTATPLDAIGALYWNPAAMGRLGHNDVSIGGNVLFPDMKVSSSFPNLGGGITSGTTRSDSGVAMTSSIGVVTQLEDEDRFTYGMGLFTLGGGGVNFPGSPGNPILSASGPFGRIGLGPIESSMTILQIAPSVSYQVTDRLIVGLGPTIDVTLANFDPAYFAGPNVSRTGQVSFPAGVTSTPFWGGGFRAGLVYSITDTLDVGFGYTSPQWLQTWKFYTKDANNNPKTLTLNPTLPAIYSWGVAWRGIDRLLLALDMRYFDYANSRLFGTPVSQGGLGWESVFSVALGANYQLTDRIAVRGGYQYNTNPLGATSTLFNVQAPGILQNTISVGTTFAINRNVSASLGYAYSFQNSISGTATQFPNVGVRLSASNQSLLFNVGIKFGGGWARPASCPTYDVTPAPAPVAAPTTTTSQPPR